MQISSGRYSNYDDFAVVLSPALSELVLPSSSPASSSLLKVLGAKFPDLSYLAPNCLYPSQKLHASSKYINNLLTKSWYTNLPPTFSRQVCLERPVLRHFSRLRSHRTSDVSVIAQSILHNKTAGRYTGRLWWWWRWKWGGRKEEEKT